MDSGIDSMTIILDMRGVEQPQPAPVWRCRPGHLPPFFLFPPFEQRALAVRMNLVETPLAFLKYQDMLCIPMTQETPPFLPSASRPLVISLGGSALPLLPRCSPAIGCSGLKTRRG